MSTARRPKTVQELAELATTHTYDPSRNLKTQLRTAEQLRRQGKEAEQAGDLETAFVNFSRASTIILDKIPQHDQYHKLSNSQKEALAGNGHDLLRKIGLLKPRIKDAHEHWVSSGGVAVPARAEAETEAAAARRAEDERQRQQKDQHHQRDAEETERVSRRKQEEKEREMRVPDGARIATESIQTPRLAPEGTITIDIAGAVNTSGAFCDLFTGTHSVAGKVALKRPRGTTYTDALMKKIEIEAGLWIKLNHPRILKFLGLYTVDEVIYLVSPFAEFGSLPSYLESSPGADRGCLVTEIAEGLAYLHQFEPAIVHGDVKGNNVLIGSDHHVRLCDFGLARHVDTRTATDLKGAGSLPWQSPEILRDGLSKSLQSDVYAFGITIYEVLSGKEPYSDRSSIGSIITGVLLSGLRPPLEPSSAPDGTPYLRFWGAATRCWSDNPAERPSMANVLQSLKLSTSPDSLKSSSQSSTPTLLYPGPVPELRTPFSPFTTPEPSSGPESMSFDEPPETHHQQKHYGTESEDTDDLRANNWTLPRPAPPMRKLSRVHYSHLNDQEFALHSRGAPVNMIHKRQMRYDSKGGISLKVEHRLVSSGSGFRFTLIRPKTVWIGWNLLEIDKMDVDGTEYVNAILKDMSDRPQRWMEVPSTYTSETTVYRLVRKLGPEDVDYGLDAGV